MFKIVTKNEITEDPELKELGKLRENKGLRIKIIKEDLKNKETYSSTDYDIEFKSIMHEFNIEKSRILTIKSK